MYLNGLTAASRAPVAAAKAAGTYTGTYKGNCPSGQRQIGVDMGPAAGMDRVACALIPKAVSAPPRITISPTFQQQFSGQVSPVVSPIIGSSGAQTGGAPSQAGGGGQATGGGISQAQVDAQLQAQREAAARERQIIQAAAAEKAILEGQLRQAQSAEQQRAFNDQLRQLEAEANAKIDASNKAAEQAAQASPQFIPGAQIIEQTAAAPVNGTVPPKSDMPGWVVPAMIIAAVGGVIFITKKGKRK